MPKHNVELSLIEGNFWQLSDRKGAKPSEGIRAHWKSAAPAGPESMVGHVAQRESEKLVALGSSLIGLVTASFTKAMIACRQRGQAIVPGGPETMADVLFVEHR